VTDIPVLAFRTIFFINEASRALQKSFTHEAIHNICHGSVRQDISKDVIGMAGHPILTLADGSFRSDAYELIRAVLGPNAERLDFTGPEIMYQLIEWVYGNALGYAMAHPESEEI